MNNEIDFGKIYFRPAGPEDAVEHFRAIQESYKEASQFLPFFVGMERWTIPQHEKYLKQFGSIDVNVKNFLFFYEEKVIGAGHLKKSIWDHSGELLYWTRSGWDGIGIGQFIAKTMMKSASTNFGYRFMVIQTDRNNIGSKKVAEKLGGSPEMIYGYTDHYGRQSNMVVWVIPMPVTKIASPYDSSYVFNPYTLLMDTIYRFDHEGKLKNYIAHDPSLERNRESKEQG